MLSQLHKAYKAYQLKNCIIANDWSECHKIIEILKSIDYLDTPDNENNTFLMLVCMIEYKDKNKLNFLLINRC